VPKYISMSIVLAKLLQKQNGAILGTQCTTATASEVRYHKSDQ